MAIISSGVVRPVPVRIASVSGPRYADRTPDDTSSQRQLAEVEQAQAEVEFAEREHKRANQLIRNGTISQRDLELAERNIDTSRAALSTAIAALDVRNYELERAQAALVSPIDTTKSLVDCDCISIRSPVNGQILL